MEPQRKASQTSHQNHEQPHKNIGDKDKKKSKSLKVTVVCISTAPKDCSPSAPTRNNGSATRMNSKKSLTAPSHEKNCKQKCNNQKNHLKSPMQCENKEPVVEHEYIQKKIGIFGGGKMADSLIHALKNCKQFNMKNLYVAVRSDSTYKSIESKGFIDSENLTKRSYDLFGRFDCDIIFLCIHGAPIRACFKYGGLRPKALTVNYIPYQGNSIYVLSLVGGVSLKDIRTTLLNPEIEDHSYFTIRRLMLTFAVSYKTGFAAINEVSTSSDVVILRILNTLVNVEVFPETLMDAACALCGSGAAYCYYFVSAMAYGGFRLGLSKEKSLYLAGEALHVASKILLHNIKKGEINIRTFVDSVTSQAGPVNALPELQYFEKGDCSGTVASAVEGAFHRIRELTEKEPNEFVDSKLPS